MNFWRNINRRGPYKNGENLYYLKLCKENISCQNYLFHSSKEVFLHNFTQFLENWIFEGILTGADLTKMVKICIILICAKKIFFGKIICSPHQRKCFSTILRDFWKIEFWRNIDRRWPYKNGENLYILICAKKIFFGKIIYLTHQKKCFSTILRNFLKIEFLKGYRQARGPFKNGKNLNYLKLSTEIIFWQNYLFHSSKEEFLHSFRQILENWIFEGISTGADLTKMVNIWTILNCAKKIFFGKIICSTHQRKCSSTILGNFEQIEFWRNINRCGPYKNGENLYYLNLFYKNMFWQNYLFHSSKEVFLHNFTQFLENWIFEGTSTGADLKKWW